MNKKPLHILLVNNYTIRGGIPNAVVSLANEMKKRGHSVTIVSQKPVPGFLYPLYILGHKIKALSLEEDKAEPLPLGNERLENLYKLEKGIKILPYNFTDKNTKIQSLRRKLAALDPDVCVCPFPDGAQLVWAVTLMGSGIPYVYSEHHCPQTIEKEFWSRKGRLAAMSGADAIHVLLPSYLESVPEFNRSKARAIPNSISLPDAIADPVGPVGDRRVLLWMSRLHESLKQCSLALDAFAMLANEFPDWDFHLAGDGQDSAMLHAHAEKLSKKYNIPGRIKFLGNQKNVWPVLASAQAFCFSSRTEGLPIALLEAQAAGLPAVAFRQCQGMTDLIRHGENGLLADDMTARSLAEQLKKLLSSPDERKRMGLNARNGLDSFSAAKVYDDWENMLYAAASAKGATELDNFSKEPFASQARLASMARREWLWRDFGMPVPYTFEEFIYRHIRRPLRWAYKKYKGVSAS